MGLHVLMATSVLPRGQHVRSPMLHRIAALTPRPTGTRSEARRLGARGGERNSGEVVHSRTLQAQTHTGVIICWYQYGLY